MLSLSIFPRNHPIKCKSLVRRLVAEGLVGSHDKGFLNELINRCIVEPVQICRYSNDVKSCKVDVGILLEFIIHKSLSTNFVTLIQEEEVVHNTKGRIRRLSVQSSTSVNFEEVATKNKMSETIRSLTIIPPQERSEVPKIVKSWKFLRLLDLEGCTGIDVEFLKGICKLIFLKYLSLRKTDVKKIPKELENLSCLQTLDIRETRDMGLPKEVITLPKLAFLFGWFVLPKMSNKTEEFLEEKSELQTIAGFVVSEWKGSEHIILKARKLTKVKVRCTDTINTDFILSLWNCFSSLKSVSIQSNQLSTDIMPSLDAKYPLPNKTNSKIPCMKLEGKLDRLPGIATLMMMDILSKLQLSNTGLKSEDLSALQNIPKLEYLKLQDNGNHSWVGSFSVFEGGFVSLKKLCFQASKLPKLEFVSGSMKSLTSLHLLCQDISKMQGVEDISNSIKHITCLNEVILHSSATRERVEAWKTAAKSNQSRPRVTTSTCS